MTKDDFIEWKQMPQTKEFFTFLLAEEHARRLVVAEGACSTEDNIAHSYIKYMAEANVFNVLANIQYEDLNEDDGETEAAWPSSASSTG